MNEIVEIGLREYQGIAVDTDQNADEGLEGLPFLLLGLFGEVGTLLSALKKRQRDRESFLGYNETVIEEFGDSLWYFSNIATRAGIQLTELAGKIPQDLQSWVSQDISEIRTFAEVQDLGSKLPMGDESAFESSLLELAGKVGLLLNEFAAEKLIRNRDSLSGHLLEIFRAFAASAHVYRVSLSEVIASNVKKIHSRWPKKEEFPPLFDNRFPLLEQIPRRIDMQIIEIGSGEKARVLQRCNDINIGSLLTDNKRDADDYRFHDIFHLANAAILGWSPVLRALFKVKRKSDPKTDEAEDGQRAGLIEEGISTLIFQRAQRLRFFDGISHLDYSLLKMISEFVSGYEVSACPLWLWERAILEGYAVFRQMREFRKGIVTANLMERTLTFSPLTK